MWSGRFLGITGWHPSACKSNRLHVDILRFSFIKLGYTLYIPLQRSVIILQSWISTGYFSNSTGSFVTNCRFSLIIDPSDIKSNRLHVGTSQFCFHSFEVHSIGSSKTSGNFLKSWTSTGYFSNSTGSSATNRRLFPDIGSIPRKLVVGFGRYSEWTHNRATYISTVHFASSFFLIFPPDCRFHCLWFSKISTILMCTNRCLLSHNLGTHFIQARSWPSHRARAFEGFFFMYCL